MFTETPSTLEVHWLIGADLGLAGPVVAFLVTGVLLRRDGRCRARGTYSLAAGVITLVLVGFMGWVFTRAPHWRARGWVESRNVRS